MVDSIDVYDRLMSQPVSGSGIAPVPDSTIMKRLGFVRLLYRQAVSQSHVPAPLNFSSVLAFHDAMELFFLVAIAHLGNPQGLDLKKPFPENAKRFTAPDGKPLLGLDGVHRTGHDRNGLKHNGSIPGPDQIEHARRDVTTFLEYNCPRLFGIEFSDISMLHIVPQDAVRGHLSSGRAEADAGEIQKAMAHVALAFDTLVTDWSREKYLPGDRPHVSRLDLDLNRTGSRREIERFRASADRDVQGLASSVESAFAEMDSQLAALRQTLRLQVAGVDMAGYVRFAMITPAVSWAMNGESYVTDGAGKFHYTSENYDLCEMFVVDSALRMGHGDFSLWMPQTWGDNDRARAAMAANGGRLPNDMQHR